MYANQNISKKVQYCTIEKPASLPQDWFSLNPISVLLREKLVLEQEEVDSSDRNAAVCKVEYCSKEGLRIFHPRQLIVKEREVEHIHHLSEKECEWRTRHHCLRPYHAIEKAIQDVSHCTCCNQGQTHKNSDRCIWFLCQFIDPPAQGSEKYYSENR